MPRDALWQALLFCIDFIASVPRKPPPSLLGAQPLSQFVSGCRLCRHSNVFHRDTSVWAAPDISDQGRIEELEYRRVAVHQSKSVQSKDAHAGMADAPLLSDCLKSPYRD